MNRCSTGEEGCYGWIHGEGSDYKYRFNYCPFCGSEIKDISVVKKGPFTSSTHYRPNKRRNNV